MPRGNPTKIRTIRLTNAEWTALGSDASNLGLTKTMLVAEILRAYLRIGSGFHYDKQLPEMLGEYLQQLRRIGLNVNQIARGYNTGKYPPPAKLITAAEQAAAKLATARKALSKDVLSVSHRFARELR